MFLNNSSTLTSTCSASITTTLNLLAGVKGEDNESLSAVQDFLEDGVVDDGTDTDTDWGGGDDNGKEEDDGVDDTSIPKGIIFWIR